MLQVNNQNTQSINNQAAYVAPTYLTVKMFCQKHRAFKEGQIRFQIFNRAENGMNDFRVIVKNGGRVYINEQRYFEWMESGAAEKQ